MRTPEEQAAADAAAATPVEPPETAPVEPVIHPWDKEVTEYFAGRESITPQDVSEYLATKRQPYITKLEAEKAELESQAAWYHGFEDDPEATLAEAVTQLYGEDAATRVLELVAAGATAAEAETVLAVEEADESGEEVPEWARQIQERIASDDAARAAADEAAQAAAEQQSAEEEYWAWYNETTESNPDIKDDPIKSRQLHMYVATCDTLEEAMAAFRADYPEPEKAPAPPAAPGGHSNVLTTRQISGSFAEKMGAAYDALAGPKVAG